MRRLTRRSVVVANVLAVVCMLTACAARQGGGPSITQEVHVDHLFTVVVLSDDTSTTGCTIKVDPDGPEVKIQRGDSVGWKVSNFCDDAQGLKLDFKHNGKSYPILRKPRTSGSLFTAEIKSRWRRCHEEAPCGLYKYDIAVGKHFVDPEFEIIY